MLLYSLAQHKLNQIWNLMRHKRRLTANSPSLRQKTFSCNLLKRHKRHPDTIFLYPTVPEETFNFDKWDKSFLDLNYLEMHQRSLHDNKSNVRVAIIFARKETRSINIYAAGILNFTNEMRWSSWSHPNDSHEEANFEEVWFDQASNLSFSSASRN